MKTKTEFRSFFRPIFVSTTSFPKAYCKTYKHCLHYSNHNGYNSTIQLIWSEWSALITIIAISSGSCNIFPATWSITDNLICICSTCYLERVEWMNRLHSIRSIRYVQSISRYIRDRSKYFLSFGCNKNAQTFDFSSNYYAYSGD